jgi:undecaprenyl-diphosphatase
MISLDTQLFHLVNHGLANPFFDLLMPAITNVSNFYPIYVLLLGLLAWRGGAKGRWCVLLMLLAVAVADPISSRIIKESVGRLRPCATLADVRLLVPCGAGKSFPSSHAVNNFAAAVVAGHFYPRARIFLLIYAALVAFSRVYVGVHYPGDVLGGAAIGSIIGLLVLLLWEVLRSRYGWLESVAGSEEASSGRLAE